MSSVFSRVTEMLDSLPFDANPTLFAVRSHAVAAAIYSAGLEAEIHAQWGGDLFPVSADSVEVAQTQSGSLVFARYRAGHGRAPKLIESNRHATVLNLGPGSLDLLVYRTIDAKRDDPFSRPQLLGPIFRTLAVGEVVATLAGQEIIELIPTQETVVAWILSRPTDRVPREYYRQAGSHVNCREGVLAPP